MTDFPWNDILTSRWGEFFPHGPRPRCAVLAPGRVNLIGEHVDHQAYPVCPCAIRQSLGALVSVEAKSPSNSFLEVASLDTAYLPRKFSSISDFRVIEEKVWTNYVVAAYFGVVEYWINGCDAERVGQLIEPKVGITSEMSEHLKNKPQSPLNYSVRILLTGNIPAEVGLSSSAALVVSCTLALAYIGGQSPSKRVLADVCARAERYTGVASGGMDQAAILLSQRDTATLIHFKPLETRSVKLPHQARLIIANSCRVSPKAKMAAKMYNKRVFELKAGCLALLPPATASGISCEELLDLQLRDVVREHLQTTEQALLEQLHTRLRQDRWTRDDMTRIFGETRRDYLLHRRCGFDVWEQNEDFCVFQRVRHVLSEAVRVEEFADTCNNTLIDEDNKLRILGALMDASGHSMNQDFEASCPEVQEIIGIAKQAGALGARVTGAGWGGCVVILAHGDQSANQIVEAIKNHYYIPLRENRKVFSPPLELTPPLHADLSNWVFITTPGDGATVYGFGSI